MKKIFVTFCLFLIGAVSVYSQITGSVSINESDVSLSRYEGYDIISWSRTTDKVRQPGAPELPVLIQTFVIPQGMKVDGVEVIMESRARLDGTYIPYPAQEPVSVGNADVAFTEPDSAIYHAEDVYPTVKAEIVADYNEMGYHLVSVRLYPMEWNPQTHSIFLCSFSFIINYTHSDEEQIQPMTQSARRTKAIRKIVKSMVQNPQNVGVLPYQQAEAASNGTSSMLRAASSNINRIEEQAPDYIIITNNALKKAFQRLADWKIQKGVPTVMMEMEKIKTNYSGSDLAEKVHAYLQECYHKWGPGLFVLLGGDVNVVPARYYKGKSDEDNLLYPSDAYYADLESDWNANGNHIFGETGDGVKKDRLCYVGRAAVENEAEAATFVNKVLAYEKMDVDGINKNYLMNHLVASAYITKNESSGRLTEGGQSRINGYLSAYPQLQKWYLFDHYNCTCSYHAFAGTFTHGEELNREHFLSSLNGTGNSGLGYFHIVYHMDHSHPRSLGTSTKDKGETIQVADVDGLRNGNYLQIVVSGGCKPATFTEDCIAEHFLNNPYGGAVAFIGNANNGYSGEHFQYDSLLVGLYEKPWVSLGTLYQHMISKNYESSGSRTSDYFRLQLLGDPEMPVWSAVPQNLDVTVTPVSVEAGQNTLTVQIRNLPVGEEVTVCLMKDAEVYKVCEISDRNVHSFLFTPKQSGTLKVTVTARNFLPFVKNVPVTVSTGNLLSVQNVNYASDIGITSGQTKDWNIMLKNNGQEMATHVVATLSTSSPYIEILNHTVMYDTILAGRVSGSSDSFRVKAADNAPEIGKNEWNAACFYLTMAKEGTQEVDVDTFRVNLLSCQYKIGSIKIKNLSNSDSIPGPGDLISLLIKSVKMGKGNLTQRNEVTPIDVQYIDSLYNATSTGIGWRLQLKNNYVKGRPLRVKVSTLGILQDSVVVDISKLPPTTDLSKVYFEAENNAISFHWNKMGTETFYNIYRAETERGAYLQQNKLPLTTRYYKDEGLGSATEYYYKISALDAVKQEGPLSSPLRAWTTYPMMGLFPLAYTDKGLEYVNEAYVADFDYDGQKEIVMAAQYYVNSDKGRITVIRPDGMEPYDIDGNVTSFSGFAEIPLCTTATPVVADIHGNGIPHVIVLTRNYHDRSDNAVFCYSSQDNDKDNRPDLVWQKSIDVPCYRSAVVTDIDAPDGKGEKEIIFRGDIRGPIRVWDVNGNQKAAFGENLKGFFGGLAVADLDGDGYKEIICGSDSSIYVWRHNGTPYKRTPFFTRKGHTLSSSPVVCDLDGDGEKEILVASRTTTPGTSYVYAIKQDGTCIGNFDSKASSPVSTSYSGVDHAISVGDINNDGQLEVLALGTGYVYAWNCQGEQLFARNIPGLFSYGSRHVNTALPILADVDGDEEIDIVFNDDKKIYACHHDGTDIKGFPLTMENTALNSVAVSDIDNDGRNEIIAGDELSFLYAWKTEGKPSSIEWGCGRFDTEFTGEYVAGYQDPWVITANSQWNGGLFMNDIIVRSGTFKVPSGKTLQLADTRRIIVMDGATLEVDGGLITHADVRVLGSGKLVLKNGGVIRLRRNASVMAEANVDIEVGEIQVTP